MFMHIHVLEQKFVSFAEYRSQYRILDILYNFA